MVQHSVRPHQRPQWFSTQFGPVKGRSGSALSSPPLKAAVVQHSVRPHQRPQWFSTLFAPSKAAVVQHSVRPIKGRSDSALSSAPSKATVVQHSVRSHQRPPPLCLSLSNRKKITPNNYLCGSLMSEFFFEYSYIGCVVKLMFSLLLH